MKSVEVKIVSMSPYSQSRLHNSPKLEKESHEAYEQRTWREKCNFDQDGIVYIPSMAFKQALDTVAKRLSEKTTGKGTLTKHFVGGVLCAENASIGYKKDEACAIPLPPCLARSRYRTFKPSCLTLMPMPTHTPDDEITLRKNHALLDHSGHPGAVSV